MGANAAVVPIGDMVPDEWMEATLPVVIPPPPDSYNEENSPFHGNNEIFTFGNRTLLGAGNNKVPLIDTLKYPETEKETSITLTMSNANNKDVRVVVTVYNAQGDSVFTGNMEVGKKESKTISIKPEILKKGYTCHVTVEAYDNKGKLEYRDTVVITIT